MATFVPSVIEYTPPAGTYGRHFFVAAVHLGTREIWSSKLALECRRDAERDAQDIADVFNAKAALTGGEAQLRL